MKKYKPKQFWKVFTSENHIGYFEEKNGIYVPKHVGKSSLQSWISQSGRDFEYDIYTWKGCLFLDETRYFFESRYVNHRPLKGPSISDAMKRGDTILFDELLSIIWNNKFGKTKFSQNLMDILIGRKHGGFRFKEISYRGKSLE
ncbi:MAG: hypothetical protein AABX03_00565 [Nanoarchaeota archaeon]